MIGRLDRDEVEERDLRRFDREEMVVAAVQHEKRNPDARHEVDLVRLRQRTLELETSGFEDRGPQTVLDGEHHGRHRAAPAQSDVREGPAIDVRSRFEVVN